MNGPATPRTHGFCDAPVEMKVGVHRMTACCDLPRGHTGEHQALLHETPAAAIFGAAIKEKA
jgi:hypothetical protein